MIKPVGFRVNEQQRIDIDNAIVKHGVSDERSLLLKLITESTGEPKEPIAPAPQPEPFTPENKAIIERLQSVNGFVNVNDLFSKMVTHIKQNSILKFKGL